MTDKQSADTADAVARNPGILLPSENPDMTPEQFERLSAFGDPRARRTPRDYYVCDMVAASNGLDSYFTRQDPGTSMRNFVVDLRSGQSLLGSHKTDTFSTGLSFDGRIEQADPAKPFYEPTFYRQFDIPSLRSTEYTVGSYAIPRGLTLNGQPTDDLIRAIELGAVRRVSVSFSVGQYVCGIDNKQMMAGVLGPEPSEQRGGCKHFPGVEYPGDGLAWAWMRNNDLQETSLVFKNSSPGAMFYRAAEEYARRGLLPDGQVTRLESRLAMRLPRYERRLWSTAAPKGQEATVEDELRAPAPGDAAGMSSHLNAAPPDGHGMSTKSDMPMGMLANLHNQAHDKGADHTHGNAADAGESRQPGDEAGVEDEGDEAEGDATAGDGQRHGGHSHSGPTKGGHKKRGEADTDPSEDGDPEDREAIVLGRMVRSAFTPESGETPTFTQRAIEELRDDAKLGRDLFAQLVDRAVEARVAVQREAFNKDKYRAVLLGTRDVEYVVTELETWDEKKKGIFTPGRTVPAPAPAAPAARPDGAVAVQSNIVGSLGQRS